MAEITRQRTGQIIDTVLRILSEYPDGLATHAAIAEAEKRLPPTDFEQSDYPSTPGRRRYDKIVRFATITPVKAGWMIKDRGTWTITDAGRGVIGKYADPADLAREAVRLYRKWKAAQPGSEDEGGDEEDPKVGIALEEAEEAAWQEISQYLAEIPPYEFQGLVAALLQAMGYYIAWTAPPGPDQGIDIIASTDPLGAKGPRIKVQVKRHQGKIGVDGIRAFLAVLGSSDIGLYVCTGGFTSDAEREARTQENRRITLLDSRQLVDLWIRYESQLSEEARQQLPLRPVHFLAPVE